MKTITKALIAHHDEMRKLVEEIKQDPSRFYLLGKHLDVHHELEEDLLLSKLHSKKEIKDESLESQEEHFVLNILLLDLKDFPKDNSRWIVKFKVFEEILEHHLSEEEEELFPEAEKILSKEEQATSGAQFMELKKRRLEAALETKPVRELEKPKKAE
ncbi:MAG: hemerythrin domain-containing protein [Bacteroidales bacterium]|nr:hemerythrin domain-containing protein [Bacteroidales bacterium]